METVGKILSLTLLTIFGSAAATIYMVDSNFFSSVSESPRFSYTREVEDDDYLPEPSKSLSDYRERQKDVFYPVKSPKKMSESGSDSAMWSQTYSRNKSIYASERVKELASLNTKGELREEMHYWKEKYQKALKERRNRDARKAYREFKDYKNALEVKKNDG